MVCVQQSKHWCLASQTFGAGNSAAAFRCKACCGLRLGNKSEAHLRSTRTLLHRTCCRGLCGTAAVPWRPPVHSLDPLLRQKGSSMQGLHRLLQQLRSRYGTRKLYVTKVLLAANTGMQEQTFMRGTCNVPLYRCTALAAQVLLTQRVCSARCCCSRPHECKKHFLSQPATKVHIHPTASEEKDLQKPVLLATRQLGYIIVPL